MKRLLILSLIFYLLILTAVAVKAETQLEMHLNKFYYKQKQASEKLKVIEQELKDGFRDTACERQREAAMYGIEATESLIKAFELNGSKNESDSIKAGLNKWKELRDYCY